ncbi:MAG: MFS transporter [Thiohalocapsa sp.]|nr:MFS transporter [Thiohalocapsa sp.]
MSSNIGQTYFIALFAVPLRADLGLSHGGFGGLFMLATIASALTLVWLGKVADSRDPVMVAALTLALLAGSALLLAGADSVLWLVIALFGLRLFGQGMTSHLAMTFTARWFGRERGRALGLTFLGYPAGEAVLPILVALLLGLFTWRWIWVGIAIAVVVILVPALFLFGRGLPSDGSIETPGQTAQAERPSEWSWTRAQVLRDPRFYGLLPGILAAPFVITGVFFHQLHLVEIKGWSLSDFAACYPLYAASGTVAALACGWLVDSYGALRLLPFFLLPLAVGLALLGSGDSIATAAGFMAAMGATAGAATILWAAALAELYGTAHLGAIRALVVALKVLATALAPAILGLLIDQGVGLDRQATLLSLLVCASALGLALMLPSLLREHAAPAPRSI